MRRWARCCASRWAPTCSTTSSGCAERSSTPATARPPRRRRGHRRRVRRAAGRAGRPRVHRLLPAGQPGRGAAAGTGPAWALVQRPTGLLRRARRPTQARPAGGAAARARGAPGPHRPSDRGPPPGSRHRDPPGRRGDRPAGRGRPRATGPRGDHGAVAHRPAASLRPGPIDEVRTAMAVFDESLFGMVPTVYRAFEAALAGPDAGTQPPTVPSYIRLGSWIGGDRDGNPQRDGADHPRGARRPGRPRAAGADATRPRPSRTTLTPRRAQHAAVGRTAQRWPNERADQHPALLAAARPAAQNEPHRDYLLFVAARLDATPDRATPTWPTAAPTSSSPTCASSRTRWRRPAPRAGVRRAAAPALAGRDVRLPPRRAGGPPALAGCTPRRSRLPRRRCARRRPRSTELAPRRGRRRSPLDDMTARSRDAAGVSALQQRWGVRACHRYVICFTRRAADLVAVHALARIAVAERHARLLDVVPLFETQRGPADSAAVLEEWLTLPRPTQAHLRDNGHRVEVMLGYSDSAKDVGPVVRDAALYEAQAALAAWAARTRHRADAVPRPRRRARPRRRPGQPGDPRPARRARSPAGSRSPSRAR